MTETPKQNRVVNTYTTLKDMVSNTNYTQAVEKIKKCQHNILINGWYDYTKID